MLNGLTPAELSKALSGLSLAEKRELLELSEELARREAEKPRDDRPSIEELFGGLRDEAAARSDDPEAYRRAWDAHQSSVTGSNQVLSAFGADADGKNTGDTIIDKGHGLYLALTTVVTTKLTVKDFQKDSTGHVSLGNP